MASTAVDHQLFRSALSLGGPGKAAVLSPVQFSIDDILQELMLALVGYTGDIFVDSSSNPDPSCTEVRCPDSCSIRLAPDIPLAEDVNREELNRLVQLGFHFKAIKQFIAQEQQAPPDARSSYRLALCSGLDEVLCLFEDEVVLLQDQLLQGGLDRGLPGITYQLADLQRLLLHVHHLVYQLRRRSALALSQERCTYRSSGGSTRAYSTSYTGLGALETETSSSSGIGGGTECEGELVLLPQHTGGRLLHWLEERRGNGEQLLRTCTQRLMWHVQQVLFNQLTLWMVHGLLIDNSGEFFITTRVNNTDAEEEEEADAAAADTACVRDSSGGGGSSGAKSAAGGGVDVAFMSEAETYEDFHSAFTVSHLQLPPGLSLHTAASIEFVGRAVRLLKSAPASAKLRQMQDSAGSYSQQQLQQQGQGQQQQWRGELPTAGAGAAAGAGASGGLCGGGGAPQQLLPYGDAMAYAAALRVLQEQPEYRPAALERTVEAIRADVASRVWQLVVVDSRLLQHLAALKDYLLLAKGDLYQGFLTDAAKLLALPADKANQKDIVAVWQSAASRSTAADDPHFRLFKLEVDKQLGEQQQQKLHTDTQEIKGIISKCARGKVAAEATLGSLGVAGPEVWQCLKLDAQLPWPLGVLITSRHVAEYNGLFQLLLKVKRVQLDLEAAWQELGRLCGRKGGSTQPRDIGELLQLRQHMGHLISNLQVYLQLDVIEANFDALQHQVEAAQDFAEVADAHERFLRIVKQQSLLYSAGFMGKINVVCSLARQLCGLVKGARERGVDWDAVQAVKQVFEQVVRELCINMRSKFLQSHERAPYLNQLHERLNYNNYLSTAVAHKLG